MRTAVLRGREHTVIGAVSAVAEARAAIALSIGGAGKTYRYKDPNEDAAVFAIGEAGTLLAVADGHSGVAASERAVEWLLEVLAPAWTGAAPPKEPWPDAARRAVAEIQTRLVAAGTGAEDSQSRTTLAFAVVRPGEDRAAWASIGDSLVFSAGAETRELDGRPDPSEFFLAAPRHEPQVLADRLRCGEGSLSGVKALVLSTDGLSEHGIGVPDPPAAVSEAISQAASESPELRPLEAARGLAEIALDAHVRHRAGDNIAVAVYWLASE